MVLVGVLLVLSVLVFVIGYLAALAFLAEGFHPKWATLSAAGGSVSFVLGVILAIMAGVALPMQLSSQMVGNLLLLGIAMATWGLIFHSWTHWSHTPVEN